MEIESVEIAPISGITAGGIFSTMPIASLLISTRSLFFRATFARNLSTMEQVGFISFWSFCRLELKLGVYLIFNV